MKNQKARSVRYTYSFTLNENYESDLINVINELDGISIAQFVKVAIMFFNEDIEESLDAFDIYDKQKRAESKFTLIMDQLKKYQSIHK